MNATKRKFNALLNGIGNKSSTSVHSLKEKETNTKRIRTTTVKPDISSRRITSSVSKHRKAASVATSTTTDTSTDQPRYCPWDREAFLQRLKSYACITDWTPKPRRINEVQWAKRGWICKGGERVRCTLCNVEVVVKMTLQTSENTEEELQTLQEIGMRLEDMRLFLVLIYI